MSAYQYQATPRDPTKVVGRRVIAAIVDGLLLSVPLAVLTWSLEFQYVDESVANMPISQFCDALQASTDAPFCFQFGDRAYYAEEVSPLFWLAGFGLSLLVLVVLQGLKGVTPGKWVTGIRTVRQDGRPPGLGRALVRWLLLAVDTFPWILPLVGWITAASTPGHRRVGDMAADTLVVDKAAAGQPIVVPGLTTAAALPGYPVGFGGAGAPGGAVPPGMPPGGWGPPPETPGAMPAPGGSWGPAHGQPEGGTPPWGYPATPQPAPGPQAPPGGWGPALAPEATTAALPTQPAPGALEAPGQPPLGQPAPGAAAPAAGSVAQGVAGEPVDRTGAASPAGEAPGGDIVASGAAPGAASAPGAAAADEPVPASETGVLASGAAASDTDQPASETDQPASETEGPIGAGEAESDPSAGGGGAGGERDAAAAMPGAAVRAEPAGGPGTAEAASTAATAATAGAPAAEATTGTPTPGEAAPPTYNPQWDAARGTYIVWEPQRGQWLGWDDSAKEWKPL